MPPEGLRKPLQEIARRHPGKGPKKIPFALEFGLEELTFGQILILTGVQFALGQPLERYRVPPF